MLREEALIHAAGFGVRRVIKHNARERRAGSPLPSPRQWTREGL